jgi:hypothetical protein
MDVNSGNHSDWNHNFKMKDEIRSKIHVREEMGYDRKGPTRHIVGMC